MTRWIGFTHEGAVGFGCLDATTIAVHEGDLFAGPRPTGATLDLAAVTVGLPCRPSKMLALWNNFHAAREKNGLATPAFPLAFVKTANSFRPTGATITMPEAAGRVVFEGELGIVIGRPARDVPVAEAGAHIFGYTCVNDVTSTAIFKADPSFDQWTRAKSLDGFGPFGPVIATGLDTAALTVKVRVNGRERQAYPIADMILSPAEIVAHLSQGMTLEPGDVISCGTSIGPGPIPKGATVEVEIEGIGILSNRFE